jgi:hypothetical protein
MTNKIWRKIVRKEIPYALWSNVLSSKLLCTIILLCASAISGPKRKWDFFQAKKQQRSCLSVSMCLYLQRKHRGRD